MERFSSILLAFYAAAIAATIPCNSRALTIGGRVWNDVNRNGMQDPDEPAFANQAVFLSEHYEFEPYWQEPFATNYTDQTGRYEFTGVTNQVRLMSIWFQSKYRVTVRNAGDSESLDNDFEQAATFCGFPFAAYPVSIDMPDDTNVDAGVYALLPAMEVTKTIVGRSGGGPLYVTNGTCIDMVYCVSNTGEAALSYVFFFDDHDPEGRFATLCPDSLRPNAWLLITNRIHVTGSLTNEEHLIAFPVDWLTCDFHDSDPLFSDLESVIIVVTNPPDFDDGDGMPGWWEILCGLDPLIACAEGANSDNDSMSDFEEYIADTNPTNSQSFLPPANFNGVDITLNESSTNRVYSIWTTTNLLDDPQMWNLAQPEQPGTGAALLFPITNNTPLTLYRTGVRLP